MAVAALATLVLLLVAVAAAPPCAAAAGNVAGGDSGATYLQFTKGYTPPGRRRRGARSAAQAFLLAANGQANPAATVAASVLAQHEPVLPPEYFLSNQTSPGGFRYAVDPELAELLSLIGGRCGFEVRGSEQLTAQQLEQHVFLKSAALFKRSRDGIGQHPATERMPRSRLLGELGHLPASARRGIKIAQFGPDFDIDLYHQSISSLLDPPPHDALPAPPATTDPGGDGEGGAIDVASAREVAAPEPQYRRPAAPKLGFQISQTSNTTKTVFEAAGYEPPSALQQVVRGAYRGGRASPAGGPGMVQILSLGPSRAGLPLHVHDESFLHLLGGLKLWVLLPPSGMHGGWAPPDLAALCLKSPSDAVPHLLRLLKDPETTPDLHVCLQEPNDVLYLPSLWWHQTLNIGEAFGLGYKATDFAFKELDLVKEVSSYAQDLLGNVAMGKGDFERAVQLYGRAARAEPFQAQFAPNYIRSLVLGDRFNEAAQFIKDRVEYLDDLVTQNVLPRDSFCEILYQMGSGLAPVQWFTMNVQPFTPALRQDRARNRRLRFALHALRGLLTKAAAMDSNYEAQSAVRLLLGASDALLVFGDLSREDDTLQVGRLVNVRDQPNAFAQLDYNRDGRLGKYEYDRFSGQQAPFSYADSNGDGYVSWEEYLGAKGKVNAQRFDFMDVDGDGAVTRTEFNAYYRGHTGSPPYDEDLAYFAVLDSELNGGDGDGNLSRSEFLGRRQFERYDPAGDGVSPADFV